MAIQNECIRILQAFWVCASKVKAAKRYQNQVKTIQFYYSRSISWNDQGNTNCVLSLCNNPWRYAQRFFSALTHDALTWAQWPRRRVFTTTATIRPDHASWQLRHSCHEFVTIVPHRHAMSQDPPARAGYKAPRWTASTISCLQTEQQTSWRWVNIEQHWCYIYS